MNLEKGQLMKLSKEDLVLIVCDLQEKREKLLQIITTRLDKALEEIGDLKSNLSEVNEKHEIVESTVSVMKNVNDKLTERITKLECKLHNQEQYPRRECIEFIGIPDSIPNNEIEKKVGDILSKIDIQACHRLKDKDRVIVKFSNRKTTTEVLRNRKKLKTVEMSSLDFPEETKNICQRKSLPLLPWHLGEV